MAADPDSGSQPYEDGEDMMMMQGSILDIKHEIPLGKFALFVIHIYGFKHRLLSSYTTASNHKT